MRFTVFAFTVTCGLRLFTTCPYFARSPQNIFRWDKNVPVYHPRITILSVVSKFAETRKETSRNGRAGRSLTYASHAGTGKCYLSLLSVLFKWPTYRSPDGASSDGTGFSVTTPAMGVAPACVIRRARRCVVIPVLYAECRPAWPSARLDGQSSSARLEP